MNLVLRLKKEDFKFAGAHFALFGPYCGERLHGHNYYVSVEIRCRAVSDDLGLAVEFNSIKPQIRSACGELDEYVLIPEKSPYLKIEVQNEAIQIQFHKKTYILPKEDVKLLPLKNISVEELSAYLAQNLRPSFAQIENVAGFCVEVEETRGQSARVQVDF